MKGVKGDDDYDYEGVFERKGVCLLTMMSFILFLYYGLPLFFLTSSFRIHYFRHSIREDTLKQREDIDLETFRRRNQETYHRNSRF